MSVDLDRPPVRLGPWVPFWVKLGVVWVGMFVVYIVDLILLGERPQLQFGIILIVIGLAATTMMSYANLRLGASMSTGAMYLSARGYPVGNTDDSVRLSDRKERSARRLLRRGVIDRPQYERIIARRHFVHGEITLVEYHEILREIADRDLPGGAAAPPSRRSL
ncbi:MAG: hypothetical protein L3K10_04440 [Thermoplasmata archaeon]|nr:hypothetical protein [Thermoplasmata archaeon]